jgi:hypothetical protein
VNAYKIDEGMRFARGNSIALVMVDEFIERYAQAFQFDGFLTQVDPSFESLKVQLRMETPTLFTNFEDKFHIFDENACPCVSARHKRRNAKIRFSFGQRQVGLGSLCQGFG